MWWKLTEALYETSILRTSIRKLIGNVGFEATKCENWRKSRTKCSFWSSYMIYMSRQDSLVFLWHRRVYGGSCQTSPFRRCQSRLQCRFTWQAWHFVTLSRVWYSVETCFVWQAQYLWEVFTKWVAFLVADAAFWRRPLSFCLTGAALWRCCCMFFANRIFRIASSGDNVQISWLACHVVTCDGAPHSTLHSTLYTLHSTLYTPHSTLHTFHTPHFTLHTLHFTLHNLHSTLCTLHSTLYTPHFTLHTLHSSSRHTPHFTLYTPHFIYSTLYTLHFTLRIPHFTLYTAPSTLTLHFTLHTLLHFSLYNLHSTLCTSHFPPHTLHFALHTPQSHFTLYTLRSPLNAPLSPHLALHPLPHSSLQCASMVTGELCTRLFN